tara:strand:+ start:7283 stop:7690 length:408 start_codon:yes stop_codon:yes gene_type:complete
MSSIGSSYIAFQSMGTMVLGVIIGIIGITGAYLAKETKNKLIWGCVGLVGLAFFWGGKKVKNYSESNPESVGKYGLILFSLFIVERVFKMFRPSKSNVTSLEDTNDTSSTPKSQPNDEDSESTPDTSNEGSTPTS